MREQKQREIEINEVDGGILKKLVEFCYTGKIEIDDEQKYEIFAVAKMFQFIEIEQLWLEHYIDAITPSNCLSMRQFLKTHNLEHFENLVNNFVLDQFLDVTKSDESRQLTDVELTELLSHNNIHVNSEEDVFNALLHWINGDEAERKAEFHKLMKSVRIKHISESVLYVSIWL